MLNGNVSQIPYILRTLLSVPSRTCLSMTSSSSTYLLTPPPPTMLRLHNNFFLHLELTSSFSTQVPGTNFFFLTQTVLPDLARADFFSLHVNSSIRGILTILHKVILPVQKHLLSFTLSSTLFFYLVTFQSLLYIRFIGHKDKTLFCSSFPASKIVPIT